MSSSPPSSLRCPRGRRQATATTRIRWRCSTASGDAHFGVPIGLICAIPQELAHLRTALADSHGEEAAHTVFDTGTIDGYEVVLAGSGMGKVNAALVTSLLADRFGCRTVIFTGVAGGLDPLLSIGYIVVADLVIQHDAGVLKNERGRTYHPCFFTDTATT